MRHILLKIPSSGIVVSNILPYNCIMRADFLSVASGFSWQSLLDSNAKTTQAPESSRASETGAVVDMNMQRETTNNPHGHRHRTHGQNSRDLGHVNGRQDPPKLGSRKLEKKQAVAKNPQKPVEIPQEPTEVHKPKKLKKTQRGPSRSSWKWWRRGK
jgi:hypothetical protein